VLAGAGLEMYVCTLTAGTAFACQLPLDICIDVGTVARAVDRTRKQ
jgi:hypothetical protein